MFVSKKTSNIISLVFCGLLAMQVVMWYYTERFTPHLEIIPDVPTLNQARMMALGDEQFYFRYLALELQNAGDSFGRFTALREYDYSALLKWMKLLDELDSESHFVPAIASYYYSNTQYIPDNKYLIEYLESTYDKDPKEKWWWLGQAVYLANHKLKDRQLALRLAFKLSNSPAENMPRWAQQMPALIAAQMGETQQALMIIKDLAERYDDYTQGEINFMNHFIKERLGYLQEQVNNKPISQEVAPLYPAS